MPDPSQPPRTPSASLQRQTLLRPVSLTPASRAEKVAERVAERMADQSAEHEELPPVLEAEEETAKDGSLRWRRKAKDRRLKALRVEESTAVETPESYMPAFAPRRVPDGAPEFDQPAEAVAHTLASRGAVEEHRGWASTLLVCGGILGVVLVAWTITLLGKAGDGKVKTGSVSTRPDTPGQADARLAAEMVPEARVLLKNFFTAQTPEEKAPFVRGGDTMLPAMRKYYALHPDEPADVRLNDSVQFETDGGVDLVLLTGVFTKSTLPFDTFVERTPAGLRLDWRFLTGNGEMEWSQWVNERPARPVAQRVMLCLDDFYAGAFSNPKDWVSLKITDIAITSTVWAYAKRFSDTGLSVVQLTAGGLRTIRMVGSFEFPPAVKGVQPLDTPQVFMRSVVSRGWLDRSPEATGKASPEPAPAAGP